MTRPPPEGPGWPPPAPGTERPEWLRPPPPGSGGPPRPGWPPGQETGRGWSPTPPPPQRPPGRRVGPLAAALILLLVVGLAAGGLVFAIRREPGAGGPAAGAPTTQAPSGGPATTRAPAATAAAPAVQEVQRKVAELRDLGFERRVSVTVEPPDKLAKRLLRTMAEETDEAELRRQGRAMELLGQLPPGTDLPRLLGELQAESVLGFYQPGRPPKGGLYVRSDRGLDPFAKFTLAHELTHAVTDQRFDLTRLERLARISNREDEAAAFHGLVEGDATFTAALYLTRGLSPAERAAVAQGAASQQTPRANAAPAAVREWMVFPYQYGVRFVGRLYQAGGWAAVDRAYRDPPTSTEQLLHPERYLGDRDQPQPVALGDLSGRLGGGWRPGADLSFGEFDARLLLQGELAVTAAEAAADGWDGGRLRTFQRGDGTALALRTVWDSAAEADQFCQAMGGWATGRFGPSTGSFRWSGAGQHATLRCNGARVAFLSAPDRPTLDRLAAAAGSP